MQMNSHDRLVIEVLVLTNMLVRLNATLAPVMNRLQAKAEKLNTADLERQRMFLNQLLVLNSSIL
jgi:hypothetical protein